MTTPAEEEFTELTEFHPDRVDGVGKGANGVPRFLIAKQDEQAGLLDPEYVRGLVEKSEAPGPADPEQVTVSGSPAAIAALIHKAAQRAEQRTPDDAYADVIKAKYDADDLKRMAGNGEAMENESYPIADEDDLHNAIRAVGRGGADHDAIRRHVITRAKALGKSSMIPDNWAADGSLKEQVSKDMDPVLDEGIDGLDPTIPLAAPEEDQPGDPADPGSPAWEAIDAATAQKWLSIAARLKNALKVMADRELLEAATADPDDAEKAWDLEDATCAVDYVISVLAVFAAGEQAEADLGGEEMDAVGKSAAPAAEAVTAIRKALADAQLPDALACLETFGPIAKAGRVLSSVNETHIREAHQRLSTVLAALPQAPTADDGQAVAKEENMDDDKQAADAEVAKDVADEQAATAGPVAATGTTGLGEPRHGGGQAALPGDTGRTVIKQVAVYDARLQLAGLIAEDALGAVAKADGEVDLTAVFNQDGDLIGVVDPSKIMPVSGAGKPAPADAAPAEADDSAAAPAAEADPADMTPAPSSEAGTAADATDQDDDGAVAKQDPQDSDGTRNVLKSIVREALAEHLDGQEPAEGIAKQADVAALMDEVSVLKARLATVEEQPAPPRVFANGATPPEGTSAPARPSLRGQDQGAPGPVNVAKALEQKRALYGAADATEQKAIAEEMQAGAINALAALHRR